MSPEWFDDGATLYFPPELELGEQTSGGFDEAERLAEEADPMAELRGMIVAAMNESRRQEKAGSEAEHPLWDEEDDGRELIDAA